MKFSEKYVERFQKNFLEKFAQESLQKFLENSLTESPTKIVGRISWYIVEAIAVEIPRCFSAEIIGEGIPKELLEKTIENY